MPHQDRRFEDRETGTVTTQPTLAIGEPVSGTFLEKFRAHLEHTIAATSWDYVIGEVEAVLKDDPDRTALNPELESRAWYVSEICKGIETVRHAIATGQAELAACKAVRVGRLWTKLDAKEHWPIVKKGRTYVRIQEEKGRLGGAARRKDASEHDEQITRLHRWWVISEDLQAQYPFFSSYVGRQAEIAMRKIQRRIVVLGLSPTRSGAKL